MRRVTYTRLFVTGLGIFLIALGLHKIFWSDPVCSEEVKQTSYIGIVGAFDLEVEAVLRHIENTTTCSLDSVRYYQGTYHDRAVLVFVSGMGLQEAKKTVDTTLSNFSLSQLIFSGIAGSVDTALPIGTVVIPMEWVNMVSGERIHINQGLIEKAYLLEDVSIVALGASFDTFVTETKTSPEEVHIVDMETASVAKSAQEHAVSFIAFRGISDEVNGEEGSDETYLYAAERSAEQVFRFLTLL